MPTQSTILTNLALTVDFGRIKANPNTIEKEMIPVVSGVKCYPYNTIDLFTPALLLKYTTLENITGNGSINYFYVHEWDRYYYLTDVSYDSGRMIVVGSEDVLMTWKNDILNQTVVIERTESRDLSNLYLPDSAVSPYAVSWTSTIDFTEGIDPTWVFNDIVLVQSY